MKKYTAALICILSQSANSSVILHQSDWESPFTPTYTTRFGSPEISSPTGVFNSRSLAFNTSGNSPSNYYDQIRYDLGSAGSTYSNFQLSFDIYTDSLINSTNQFTIFFDTPTVRKLYFTEYGKIVVKPGWGYQRVLANYNENERMHIDMMFNIGLNEWSIALDNVNIYSGIIDDTTNPFLKPAERLRSIRFSHGLYTGADGPNHLTTVYLDNVTISAVPLPPVLWLFGSGLVGLAGMAKRKKV
jgi:hypothetical protein